MEAAAIIDLDDHLLDTILAFLSPSDVANARCTCKRWAKAGVRSIRVLHSTAHRLYPGAGESGSRLSADTKARYAADVEALLRLIRRCGPASAAGNGAAVVPATQGAPHLRTLHIDEVVPQLHPDTGVITAALAQAASACTGVTSLQLSCAGQFPDIAKLTRLQTLKMAVFGSIHGPRLPCGGYTLQDLACLSQLRSLFLYVKGSSLKRPEALATLPALRELALVSSNVLCQKCFVETPDGAASFVLSSLRHLTHIRLAGCRRIVACESENQGRLPKLEADLAAQLAGCTSLIALHVDGIVKDVAGGPFNTTEDEELLKVIACLPQLRNLTATLKLPWRVLQMLGDLGSSSLDTMVLHSARGQRDPPPQPTMLPQGPPCQGHGLTSLQVLGSGWSDDIVPPLRHRWLTGLQRLSAPVWDEVDTSVPVLRQLRRLEITNAVPRFDVGQAQQVSALQRLPKLHGLSVDFNSDYLELVYDADRRGRYLHSTEVMFREIAKCNGLIYLRLAGRLHHGCTPLTGAGAASLSLLSNLVTLHYKSVGRCSNLTAEDLAAAISRMPKLQFLLLSTRPDHFELLNGEGPCIGNLGSETCDRVFEVPGLPGRSFCSKVINIMEVDNLHGE